MSLSGRGEVALGVFKFLLQQTGLKGFAEDTELCSYSSHLMLFLNMCTLTVHLVCIMCLSRGTVIAPDI